MKRTIIFLAFLQATFTSSQLSARLRGKERLDSLLSELPKAKGDTNNVKLLISIANGYRSSDYAKAAYHAKQAVALSGKLGDKNALSVSNYSLGNIYCDHSEYGNALRCYYTSMEIERATGNKVALGSLLNNVAAVYLNLSDYPKALESNLKALNLFESAGDKNGTANCLINIGNVYLSNSDNKNAVIYNRKALDIYREIGAKRGIALALNNLANGYTAQQDYANALPAFEEALKLYQETGALDGEDMALSNIANIYSQRADYKRALDYGFRALKIARENEFPEGMGYDYKAISEAYYGIATNDSTKKSDVHVSKAEALRLAKIYIDSAMAKFTEIGEISEMSDAANHASTVDAAYGNYKGAYTGYKLYKKLNDSIFNMEKDKKLTQTAMQYDFDKKEATLRAEQERKDIVQRNIRNSTLAGLAGALIFGIVVMRQRNKVKKEKARSEELLLNILPAEVAEELKAKGSAEAKLIDDVTVLFTDFKGFTQLSEKLSPKELVGEINTCFSAFDNIMQKHSVEKIKTIGDAYMAAGGLPTPNKTHAEDVVKAALEIQAFMHRHKEEREAAGKLFFEIRIGVHTGPVVAGIVGIKKFAYDIWGDTVNTASRMESSGSVGKVNISETTYELVKDKFNCEYRGEVEAKGKGVMKMYFVNT